MSKRTYVFALASLLSPLTLGATQALPIATLDARFEAPNVTLVADGCGVGFHRGPLGRCRPNAVVVARPPVVVVPPRVVPAPVVVVPPPVVERRVVAPRVVCPVGTHLGPAGRRCIPN